MVRFAARATIDEHDATHDIDVVCLEGSHQRRRGAVGAVGMIRFHEEQRFRKATIALLLGVIAFVVFVTVAALTISRPDELIIVTITPLVVVLVALLYSRAYLDVDVNGEGVTIAFRYLWPARHISFADIVAVEMRRYRPLLDYGGWGVRFGLAGWAYTTGGNLGVKLRLRRGTPVLIGTGRPRELEAAIRAGMERSADTGRRAT